MVDLAAVVMGGAGAGADGSHGRDRGRNSLSSETSRMHESTIHCVKEIALINRTW